MNFQETVDDNLAFINGGSSSSSSEMFGSTDSFKNGPENNLIMYYAKDRTAEDDLVTVVTVTRRSTRPAYVFGLLNEILVAYKERARDDGESNAFKLQMSDIIRDAAAGVQGRYGTIDAANQELDQVRVLMNDNIERVLQRGERIHLLVNKTDKLNNASHSFRRRTIAIKRRLWWNNVRFVAILSLGALILVYFVFGEVCGFPFYQECFRKDHD